MHSGHEYFYMPKNFKNLFGMWNEIIISNSVNQVHIINKQQISHNWLDKTEKGQCYFAICVQNNKNKNDQCAWLAAQLVGFGQTSISSI